MKFVILLIHKNTQFWLIWKSALNVPNNWWCFFLLIFFKCVCLWISWFYKTRRKNYICNIILPDCKMMGAFTQLSFHEIPLLILVQDTPCLTTSRNRDRRENITSGLCSKGLMVPKGVPTSLMSANTQECTRALLKIPTWMKNQI